MEIKLIYEPKVYLIGHSQINANALTAWALDSGIELSGPIHDILKDVGKYEVDHIPELAGRFCYRSFNQGRPNLEYLRNILESGHGSVLEHVQLTFIIQGVSRTLTHELVRHRIGVAISQESQRYVDAKDINFVVPPLLCERIKSDGWEEGQFKDICEVAVENYLSYQKFAQKEAEKAGYKGTAARKRANEAARWCLPGGAETRLVWSANIRTLRHFIGLRGGEAADLEIQRLASKIAAVVYGIAPNCFQDMADNGKEIVLQFGKV
jgi:thymidylate synthase (FAD)